MKSVVNAHSPATQRAFSLIELLIAVAIVGILAAVAMPSYARYVMQARRTAAISVVLQAAQYLERNMTVNNCYNYLSTADCAAQSGTELTLPDRLAHAPGEGPAYYDIGFKTSGGLSSAGYTLEAIPVSTSPQAADPCGTLLLTQAGARGARDAFTPEATVARCWGR